MHVANKVKAAELNKNAVRDSPFEDRLLPSSASSSPPAFGGGRAGPASTRACQLEVLDHCDWSRAIFNTGCSRSAAGSRRALLRAVSRSRRPSALHSAAGLHLLLTHKAAGCWSKAVASLYQHRLPCGSDQLECAPLTSPALCANFHASRSGPASTCYRNICICAAMGASLSCSTAEALQPAASPSEDWSSRPGSSPDKRVPTVSESEQIRLSSLEIFAGYRIPRSRPQLGEMRCSRSTCGYLRSTVLAVAAHPS